jgi:alpha-1,6-mannosyltransferase
MLVRKAFGQRDEEMEKHQVLNLKPFDLWVSSSAILLILGAVLISPNGDVGDVATLHKFWLGAGVMGMGFGLSWGLQSAARSLQGSLSATWFWGVAIATRLLLFPMHPGIDVWRYRWEGYIQTLGFSPYHFAPNAPELEPYRTEWWSQVIFPDVSAIYPPITELGFRMLATIAPSGEPSLYLFKVAFVLADLLVCWLLCRRFGLMRATLYAWNPMIIYSFAGGAHYDSWFILPLVAAWLLLDNPVPRSFNWLWSAVLVGISVAVKWMSLPILGFLIWRSLRQLKLLQAACIGLAGVLPMLLSALPFCQAQSCPLIPTGSVFVSYGRSAELIPHFVAKVWQPSLQANWIYLFPLALFVIWLTLRTNSVEQFAEWYWFGLLTLTPIIHFWYFTWIVPFAVSSQNWGVRLVSLSAFVYFVLPSRVPNWQLTETERLLLWLPFILGWLWTTWQNSQRRQKLLNQSA